MRANHLPTISASILLAIGCALCAMPPADARGARAARSSIGYAPHAAVDRNVNRNVNVNRNLHGEPGPVNINKNVHVDIDHDHGWHDGWYDHPVATAAAVTATAAVTAAVIGSIVNTLPSGCVTTVVNGIAYQQCGSTWYQPQYAGSNVTYIVVNPPR